MITLTKVACQGCGAALEVDSDTHFTTCRYCSSRVAVTLGQLPTVSSLQTELSKELQLVRLQRQLDELDQAWERFLSKTLIPDGAGKFHEPSVANTISATWLICGLGAILTIVGVAAQAFEFIIPGLILIVLGGRRWKFRGRENDYEAAKRAYEARHAHLSRKIISLRKQL